MHYSEDLVEATVAVIQIIVKKEYARLVQNGMRGNVSSKVSHALLPLALIMYEFALFKKLRSMMARKGSAGDVRHADSAGDVGQ